MINNVRELIDNRSKMYDTGENNYTENKMTENISVSSISMTNVVDQEKLRSIQKSTLNDLKDFLSRTFGPMGSNTKIVTGNSKDNISSSYSKDGLKVLKNISSNGPIEMSIIEEIIEITRHVEHEVGDGTTSTVILSSLIFNEITKIQKKYSLPPFQLMREFGKIVDTIKENIKESKKECTIDDIYDISMISTNGNESVSSTIKKIYEEYGMDVDLSVGISNSVDSIIKDYDGLTITEGMSDPAFINNRAAGTAEIHNANVYHFIDPIDTPDMIAFFETILTKNIYEAYDNDEDPIPTVIVCPRLTRDMSATLKELAQQMYSFDQKNAEIAKPPVLIITNVVASDELIMDDIANLCGCKSIRKYIDPVLLKKDQESGKAPTLENICSFSGKCELVVSDSKKTKFINPEHMHIYCENGEVKEDPIYTSMINFLETEIENSTGTDNAADIGLLKKRLGALKANTVDYLVGGVTISERDAQKDLVEDAIKNCKSATLYGIGRAANFEGLYHSAALLDSNNQRTNIETDILNAIFFAYYDITKILYSTVCSDEETVDEYILASILNEAPYDISSGSLPDYEDIGYMVKCSIMLDVNILDTVSKIISMMVTCNQCLLQAPHLNNY